MDGRFADALGRLPDYLGSHVLVSVTALVGALILAAVLADHFVQSQRVRGGVR